MEEANTIHEIIEFVAQSLGFVGVSFIVMGTVIGFTQYIGSLVSENTTIRRVRITLGTYTLVGLEFMVGQDIVETVINTEFSHLVGLGTIVVLRTILEHFVGKEVEHLSHEEHHAAAAHKSATPDSTMKPASPPRTNEDVWWPRPRNGRWAQRRPTTHGQPKAVSAGS